MITDTQPPRHLPPAYTLLVLAILRQAKHDLRRHGSLEEREASIAFFNNKGRYLEQWCGLIGLDYEPVHAAIVQQYPHLF
jgi:hypothetical protein